MFTEEQIKTMRRAIALFGKHDQTLKAIEELSELIKELSMLLSKSVQHDIAQVAEECADVLIMAKQVALMIDGTGTAVDLYIDKKLSRLEKTLDSKFGQNSGSVEVAITERSADKGIDSTFYNTHKAIFDKQLYSLCIAGES